MDIGKAPRIALKRKRKLHHGVKTTTRLSYTNLGSIVPLLLDRDFDLGESACMILVGQVIFSEQAQGFKQASMPVDLLYPYPIIKSMITNRTIDY